MGNERLAGLKRIACQLVAQLPDDRTEAIEVLGLARGIVDHLSGAQAPPARVIQLSSQRAGTALVALPGERAGQT